MTFLEGVMKRKLIVLAGVLAVLMGPAIVMGAGPGLERLYVLHCGQNIGKDQSRWSPGVNEGTSIEFSDNCYLIRHAKGLLLWDTGVPMPSPPCRTAWWWPTAPSRIAGPRR